MSKQLFSTHKRQLIWISFGILSLLFSRLAGLFPAVVEHVYSRGIFVGIRFLWDYSLALLPFPLLYPAILLLLTVLFYRLKKKKKTKRSWQSKLLRHSLNVLALLSAAVGLFFWLWGFNYSRIPIEKQLGLEKIEAEEKALKQEIEWALGEMALMRAAIPFADSSALTARHLPRGLESGVRESLESLLSDLHYPTAGRVRGRKIFPKGWLIGLGASGIYIPFVGEGHFDAAVYPVQHPSVLAHEMSHGYGFTDEGVCNFLALLACERSADPMIRYSGLLMYFRYLLHDLFRMDTAYYRILMANLPPGVDADLEAIRENRKQYQSWFPDFSQKVYNRYLQSQGVKEGIKSYNRVVGLYASWKKKKNEQ